MLRTKSALLLIVTFLVAGIAGCKARSPGSEIKGTEVAKAGRYYVYYGEGDPGTIPRYVLQLICFSQEAVDQFYANPEKEGCEAIAQRRLWQLVQASILGQGVPNQFVDAVGKSMTTKGTMKPLGATETELKIAAGLAIAFGIPFDIATNGNATTTIAGESAAKTDATGDSRDDPNVFTVVADVLEVLPYEEICGGPGPKFLFKGAKVIYRAIQDGSWQFDFEVLSNPSQGATQPAAPKNCRVSIGDPRALSPLDEEALEQFKAKLFPGGRKTYTNLASGRSFDFNATAIQGYPITVTVIDKKPQFRCTLRYRYDDRGRYASSPDSPYAYKLLGIPTVGSDCRVDPIENSWYRYFPETDTFCFVSETRTNDGGNYDMPDHEDVLKVTAANCTNENKAAWR